MLNLSEKEQNSTTKLMRHILGSIDLSDIEDKIDESEAERKAYCASIFAVFPRLEKDLKRFLYEQMVFENDNAETWEQVLMSRGTRNGLFLVLDHWKSAANEHIGSKTKEEDFDENEPISKV